MVWRKRGGHQTTFNIPTLPYVWLWHSGESTWDHPCDEYYRKLYEEEKKKKLTKDKAKHDKSKQQVTSLSRILGSSQAVRFPVPINRWHHSPGCKFAILVVCAVGAGDSVDPSHFCEILIVKSHAPRLPILFRVFGKAKKDVNQLLGKNKKKSRPARKHPTHPPSPEHVEAIPSPTSSIFDRKPLPGIGRQPLQRGDALDYQVLAPSASQAERAAPLSDRSPARTHAHSLVGHRLSQHLSVSVESEEGDHKSEDQEACGHRTTPGSPSRRQVRSRGEDDGARNITSEVMSAKSKHAAARKVKHELLARRLGLHHEHFPCDKRNWTVMLPC